MFCIIASSKLSRNNLNFRWRWRWWDQIQATFLKNFYFTYDATSCKKVRVYIEFLQKYESRQQLLCAVDCKLAAILLLLNVAFLHSRSLRSCEWRSPSLLQGALNELWREYFLAKRALIASLAPLLNAAAVEVVTLVTWKRCHYVIVFEIFEADDTFRVLCVLT